MTYIYGKTKIVNIGKRSARILHIFLLCFFVIFAFSILWGCSKRNEPEIIRVAIPYSDNVLDPETNYYIKWLEEKTGLNLEIKVIRQTKSEDYLNSLFASDAEMDIVMFGNGFTLDKEKMENYIEKGDIYFEKKEDIYYNYGSSASGAAGQILWINYDWLKKLGMSVPENTDELESVLTAFKANDCNGNGENDEIPLIGSVEDYSFSPVELLLNSFIYNDPYHSRFFLNENKNEQAALKDDFRSGLSFCRKLYSEGLLDYGENWRSVHDLMELVNSPDDLVGAFTTNSIADVIYSGNPEIMARFIHVAPLLGPFGERNALYRLNEPRIGAVILNRSNHKEAAKKLLDTMLSDEASLIARFGEQGVDWDYSDGKDISVYGSVSTIVTKNYIWNTRQNKHLGGIGPMNVPEEYLLGVTWNGINSDTEYIDGRSQMSYAEYLPVFSEAHDYDEIISGYIDDAVQKFVSGEYDIWSDAKWEDFQESLKLYLSS